MILVPPKQAVERKSEWFCGVKLFRSKYKVEWENGIWLKVRFLAYDSLFTCGNSTLSFAVFQFFGSNFFLNGFPNPFIVRSRSSFLFSQWNYFELYIRTCLAMFFYFLEQQNGSLYLILRLFQRFAWNLFDFSRLVSLFLLKVILIISCSAKQFKMNRVFKKIDIRSRNRINL